MPDIAVLETEIDPLSERWGIPPRPADDPMWGPRLFMQGDLTPAARRSREGRGLGGYGAADDACDCGICTASRDAARGAVPATPVTGYRIGVPYADANCVISLGTDALHYPCFDVDFDIEVVMTENGMRMHGANSASAPSRAVDFTFQCDVTLVPSSTANHWHVYMNQGMTWLEYRRLLRQLADADFIERGYRAAAVNQGFTILRLPHVRRDRQTGEEYHYTGTSPDPWADILRRLNENPMVLLNDAPPATPSPFISHSANQPGGEYPARPTTTDRAAMTRRPNARPVFARYQWGGHWWPMSRVAIRRMTPNQYIDELLNYTSTYSRSWAQIPEVQRQRISEAYRYATWDYRGSATAPYTPRHW